MSVFSPSDAVCSVTLLVLPESSMMCVASVLEPLRAANRVAGKPLYEWNLTSVSGVNVPLTCDVPLEIDGAFDERQHGDLLIVIGGFNQSRHVTTAALAVIRKAASGFRAIAGIEAGSWIIARAGLLDGYTATTHWEDFEAFMDSFPEIDVRLDRYVVDRNRMTCGGASPAFDMFLDMIRQRNGPAIAMEVASVFIYDEAHSQFDAQPLVSLGRVARKERRLEQAVRLMEKSIEQPLPVAAIARRVGVSSNTLEAIFKRHVGMTPGRFYLNLRLKAANRMVLDTDLSLREIAVRSGFNSLSAFSRAYAKGFDKTAQQMRSVR
ncbi:MAG: GlxA family transcriptional regulator [Pseudomonadota bacterium]